MKKIEDIIEVESIKYNEPMSKHTSFKVGGPADIFVCVNDISKLQKLLNVCKENNLLVTVIGNGSNVLVCDEGIRGVVIKYTANEININTDDGEAVCSGGVFNSILSLKLTESELSGFEFASGIPGTIAGAVYMNAGAYGSEVKDIVQYAKYIDISSNELRILHKDEMHFAYRKSIFQSMNTIIVEIGLKLKKDSKEKIENRVKEYKEKRIESQPLDYPNGGSTFKRGNDFIAAKLIDEAGLKGYTIGGAQVSTKHAGFIVNKGNATAKDIMDLIDYVEKIVYDKFGKKLETEVRIIK